MEFYRLKRAVTMSMSRHLLQLLLCMSVLIVAVSCKSSVDVGLQQQVAKESKESKVTSVYAKNSPGNYETGSRIEISVMFSAPIMVTGAPYLRLNTTPGRIATFVSGSGESALQFAYDVAAGDEATALDIASALALQLNGGTINVAEKNGKAKKAANIALAEPGAEGSVSFAKKITINQKKPDDAVPPPGGTIALANDASDGFINDSEKNGTTAIVTSTVASGSTARYAVVTGMSTCDALTDYALSSAPIAASVTTEGVYKVCMSVTSAASTLAYSESSPFTRDTIAPTIDTLVLANAASDGLLNAVESISGLPIATMTTTEATGDDFAFVAATATCDASVTYSLTALPAISGLAADGSFKLCARVSDNAGNFAYEDTAAVTRDATAPVFTSLVLANDSVGGYINDAEKNSASAQVTLTAAGADSDDFAVVNSAATCNVAVTYSLATIPDATVFTSDGTWKVCARLSDTAGNITYGTSAANIVRDTSVPIITAASLANEAVGGYINDSEKSATNPLLSLTGSGQDADDFAIVAAATACDVAVTYALAGIPTAADLTSDGTFKICARYSDLAGNTADYEASANIIRDVSVPAIASLTLANEASDATILFAEMNSTLDLATISASGYSALDYGIITGATTCDAAVTFTFSSIPRVVDSASDGASFKVCARASDAAGNTSAYLASGVYSRSTGSPIITSFVPANEAVGGYINDVEKSSVLDAATLTASNYDTDDYAIVASSVTCDAAVTYNLAAVPAISGFSSDGSFRVCVKLVKTGFGTSYSGTSAIVRKISAPAVTSFALANEAVGGFINNSEKLSASALATLVAANTDTSTFALVASTTTCDAAVTYDLSAVPAVSAITTDGTYKVCAKLVDLAGNPVVYGTSANIERDIVAPTFTSLAGANAASDDHINASEISSALAIAALSASGQTAADYTAILDNTPAVTCNESQTYASSSIPLTNTMTAADDTYVVCARLTDGAGNITYGMSSVFTRDIVAPSITSYALANGALDAYINASESASTSAVAALVATGANADNFGLVNSVTVCNASVTYDLAGIPQISVITPDGTYKLCVEVSDTAGNKTYGDTGAFVRDTSAPTFTSLVRANEAVGGYINDSEKAATNPLATLSGSGYDTDDFAVVTSATTCNASVTYNLASMPTAADISADGTYKICAKLSDTSGNSADYGSLTGTIVRDVVSPSVTGVAFTNEAVGGYITDAEKAATSALVSVTGAGQDSDDFAIVSTATTCDVAVTYSMANAPRAADITPDGAYKICVRYSDLAGNPVAYGSSATLTRDITVPSISAFTLANEASDGTISIGEIAATNDVASITATGHNTLAYALVAQATTCDVNVTYGLTAIPKTNEIASDGDFKLCAAASDTAGNTVAYLPSPNFSRVSGSPGITSFVLANEAVGGYINDSEKSSSLAIATLTANTFDTDDFAVVASATTCDAAVTYGSASMPIISDIPSDGSYKVCVKLVKSAGGTSYGGSPTVVRKITQPTVSGFALANEALGGYVNDSEKASTSALVALTATNNSSDDFAIVASTTTCNAAVTYNLTGIPQVDALTTDGSYKICVKLSDLAGNADAFGDSGTVVRDIVAPVFTSLVGANVASDNYINASETASTAAIMTLTANGHDADDFSAILDNTPAVTCSGQTFGSASVPLINTMPAADDDYVVCAKLTDSAGNITYGRSAVVTRDVVAPGVTSFALANAAVDAYISNAESSSGLALATLTATGAAVDDFVLVNTVTVCSAATYNLTAIPAISAVSSDGGYKLCVKLQDAAGNITFDATGTFVRDTTAPAFTSLNLANESVGGYINNAEKNSASSQVTLVGANYDAADFAIVTTATTCDVNVTYNLANAPIATDFSSDGTSKVCVKLTDAAGNTPAYGASTANIVRDTSVPAFTSMALANAATGGYINDSEKALTTDMATLVATGHTIDNYALVTTSTTCDVAVPYNLASMPIPTDLSSDGAYKICVELSDAAGNTVAYGASDANITRDIASPIFTSLVGANGASDNFIIASEAASTAVIATLTASNYDNVYYTGILDNTPAVTCNSGQTYGPSSVPAINTMTAVDDDYVVCAQLVDTAGNETYGPSSVITRDTSGPSVTTFAAANGASDGYINDSEKGSGSALVALTATGVASDDFAIVSSATTCDVLVSYNLTAIPAISAVTSDGSYKVCAKLVDAATNITWADSGPIVRDIVASVFTSAALANEAVGGYINDAERSATNALITLVGSDYTADDFAVVTSATTCNASVTYNLASVPTAADITSDGTWKICVKLSDAAGNTVAYGASDANIVRDVSSPTFTSVVGANQAVGGYINSSELASTSDIGTLSATNFDTVAYSNILDNTPAVTCSGATFGNSAIPTINTMPAADDTYVVCVKLTDTSGNITYGTSAVFTRDTAAPDITSFNVADNYISSSEAAASTALASLTATDVTSDNFAVVVSVATCNGGVTYGSASIPVISSISSDGGYKVCAELTDSAGNITYGDSGVFVRDTAAPTFTSMALANESVGGYINNAEKSSTSAQVTLVGANYDTDDFAIVSTATACDVNVTYNLANAPIATDFSSDGTSKVCVKLTDTAGNTPAYGATTTNITRDTAAPAFTSLVGANEAVDGNVTSSEASSALEIVTLSATGYSSASYTAIIDNTPAIDCTTGQTFGSSSIPLINTMAAVDDTYAVCVELTDDAGNIARGKSSVITRSSTVPIVVTSFELANGASDGYINTTESASGLALATLSATGVVTDDYAIVSSATTCDVNVTYSLASIPAVSDVTPDGTYKLCAKLTDAAASITYATTSANVVRDTAAPTITNITSSTADGSYPVGQAVSIQVTYSEAVTLAGIGPGITLLLETGTTDRAATYASGSGTSVLNFTYTVQAGDTSSDLDTHATGPQFALTGTSPTLRDGAGNDAPLSVAGTTLATNKALVIDTTAPTITTWALANEAADAYISSADAASSLALATLSATDVTTDDFAVVASVTTCGSGVTYSSANIPIVSSVSSDGGYKVCVKLVDFAGNIAYGSTGVFVRDTVAPAFTSLNLANESTDTYINNAEKNSASAQVTLVGTNYDNDDFALVSTATTCNSGVTYNLSSVPVATNFASDGAWKVCVRLSDLSGNTSAYGTSTSNITRDISPPTAGTFSTSTSITSTSFSLVWSAASDTSTAAASLQYLVCTAGASATIASLSGCEVATSAMAYTANTLTLAISGKTVNTTYHYNAVVRDLAGNTSVYNGKSQTTAAPPILANQSAKTFTSGTAITAFSFANTGFDATGCSGTLPAGLSRAVVSGTCQVSGTPTAVATIATYTITAAAADGSTATATVDITVNAGGPNHVDPPVIDAYKSASGITYCAGPFTVAAYSSAGTGTVYTSTGTQTLRLTISGSFDANANWYLYSDSGCTAAIGTESTLAWDFSFATAPVTRTFYMKSTIAGTGTLTATFDPAGSNVTGTSGVIVTDTTPTVGSTITPPTATGQSSSFWDTGTTVLSAKCTNALPATLTINDRSAATEKNSNDGTYHLVTYTSAATDYSSSTFKWALPAGVTESDVYGITIEHKGSSENTVGYEACYWNGSTWTSFHTTRTTLGTVTVTNLATIAGMIDAGYVYVTNWGNENGGGSGPGAQTDYGTIQFNYNLKSAPIAQVAKLAFTATGSGQSQACNAVTIQSRSNANAPTNVTANRDVLITLGGSGSGSLYTTSGNCASNTGATNSITAQILSGTNTATIYFKDAVVESTHTISGAESPSQGWTDASGSISLFAPPTETMLSASDGVANDYLSTSSAVSGNTVVIGADGKASSKGGAYIYRFDPSDSLWKETILTASDGVAGDRFGISSAVSDNTVVIGALGKASSKGGAYIYRFDPSDNLWKETILNASDGVANDRFGSSSALSGNTVVIGAWGKASSKGGAYIYRFDPSDNLWKETILTASDGVANDQFGVSSALSGNTVVIGAVGKASSKGGAYIYRFDPSDNLWEQTILTASDGAANDRFGNSSSVSGNTVVIGADGKASNLGAAYIYRFDLSDSFWKETILTASDGVAIDRFGSSAAVSGNTVVIGAYGKASSKGGAYIYSFDPSDNLWKETILNASDGVANDRFGSSSAVSGNSVVIGAFGKASNIGGAYVYKFSVVDPSGETKLSASDGATYEYFGSSAAVSDNTVVIAARGKANYKGAAYIYRFDPSDRLWKETILTASDGVEGEKFGSSTAVSGDTVVIGASSRASLKGGAYIYRFDPSDSLWKETILTASDGAAYDYFGSSAAVSGNTVVIGAYGKSGRDGGAYIYRFDPSDSLWKETILTASDGLTYDDFGHSAAVSGNTVVIGAYGKASAKGGAYIYRFDPSDNLWKETILTASDGVASDRFGSSTAVSGNTVVIGASSRASLKGGAYIYRFDPSDSLWKETILTASDGAANDTFGESAAVSGNTVVIGADNKASNKGGAYIYRFDPSDNLWKETILTASDGVAGDLFGVSSAVSGNTVVIGADRKASSKGRAYIYQLP